MRGALKPGNFNGDNFTSRSRQDLSLRMNPERSVHKIRRLISRKGKMWKDILISHACEFMCN
jgi:hypothetical protein